MRLKKGYASSGSKEDGQGLVEYALILTLASLVVIIVLAILGPSIGNVFSNVVDRLENLVEVETDAVAITRSDYDPGAQMLHLHATSDGSTAPGVTMTASPGGVMMDMGTHYHLYYFLPGCPCTVTVTSSAGGTSQVNVVP